MSDIDFWRQCADVQKLHGEPTVDAYRVAARTVVEFNRHKEAKVEP